MIKSIGKDFWEGKHQENSNWLTGTGFESLLAQFKITKDNFTNKKVLEIGVGKASCSMEIAKLASEFYCCDISKIALDKVKDIATQTFLTTDISQAPAVDLAICHLVFVHCTDEEMLRIINGVTLTDGGRFMFHCSGLKNDTLTDRAKKELVDDGSHFFRSVSAVKDIVAQSNKQLVKVSDPVDILHAGWFDHQWYYVTVQ